MNSSTYLFSTLFMVFIVLVGSEEQWFDADDAVHRHISLEIPEEDDENPTTRLLSTSAIDVNTLVLQAITHLEQGNLDQLWQLIFAQSEANQYAVLSTISSQLFEAKNHTLLRTLLESQTETQRIQMGLQFDYAKLLARQNDPDAAINAYQALLNTIPSHQSAAINLGILLNRKARYQDTVNALTPSLSLSAGQKKAKLLSLIGSAYKAMNKWRFAEKRFVESINYRPSHGPTWLNLAQVQRAQGRPYDEVKQTYLRATALQPNHYRAWYELGEVAVATADFPLALTSLKRALAVNPKHSKSRLEMAWALFESKQFDASMKQWQWLEKHSSKKSQRLTAKYMQSIINGEENQLAPLYRYQTEKTYVEALSLAQQQQWRHSIQRLSDIQPDNPFYLRGLLRQVSLHQQLGEEDQASRINALINDIKMPYDESAELMTSRTCQRTEFCHEFSLSE